uniref:Uncharacterized protein n=1 Tax=Timema monikensis TaxID=170555 RepID=A0A7R9E5K8_9NEOP|nr:unnamed protein product [Timema monikensis]
MVFFELASLSQISSLSVMSEDKRIVTKQCFCLENVTIHSSKDGLSPQAYHERLRQHFTSLSRIFRKKGIVSDGRMSYHPLVAAIQPANEIIQRGFVLRRSFVQTRISGENSGVSIMRMRVLKFSSEEKIRDADFETAITSTGKKMLTSRLRLLAQGSEFLATGSDPVRVRYRTLPEIFREAVDLEWGQLSLMRTKEELLK